MSIEKYQKELTEVQNKVNLAVEEAWDECIQEAIKQNNKADKQAKTFNEAPCTVCKETEYIIKYREVVGEIHGKTTGYFSLFGGSIHGYIDGETHTNPVLCCRNCENEKRIEIPSYTTAGEILKGNLPHMWEYVTPSKASEWLQERGLEVARGLCSKTYLGYDSVQNVRKYSNEDCVKVGLVLKYTWPAKPYGYAIRTATEEDVNKLIRKSFWPIVIIVGTVYFIWHISQL